MASCSNGAKTLLLEFILALNLINLYVWSQNQIFASMDFVKGTLGLTIRATRSYSSILVSLIVAQFFFFLALKLRILELCVILISVKSQLIKHFKSSHIYNL